MNSIEVKVTNQGRWPHKHYKGERRGRIKVDIAVDVENKRLLSIEVTDEKTGDSEIFEELIEHLDLEDCLADGAYDSEEVLKLLEEKGVGPLGIKVRKNARTGLLPRGQAVKEFQELGDGEWKKHEYGKR